MEKEASLSLTESKAYSIDISIVSSNNLLLYLISFYYFIIVFYVCGCLAQMPVFAQCACRVSIESRSGIGSLETRVIPSPLAEQSVL